MRNKTRGRTLALLLSLVLLLGLLPTAAFAAGGNTIYTDMSYKGQEDGTESRPYANFEDAVAKAQDGDTIIIKGKAYANVREESGVSPLVIDKRVTITGHNGKAGELYVRAGGIVLGADVTMTDVELNLANKYHNAIFANGYSFTANNVTRGSGSREVHLYAGGISAGISGIDALPASGSSAVLNLTNSTFGNIYAGGTAVGVDGDVSITASGSALGSVYASGTQEKAPDGNWFDTSEPAAPEAWNQYRVTGSVRVTTDGSSITTVENMAKPGVSVTVNNAWESRVLNLTNVDVLTVNGGKATVASVNDTAAVTVSGNASIDLSRLNDSTIGSLTGEGTLILGKNQTLTITNAFDGTWAFETVNGFNGKSGVAEYGHTYITAGGGSANVTFNPHSTQSDMTLGKEGDAWKSSEEPETLTYVTRFDIVEESVTVSKDEINQNGAELNINWTNPSQIPQLIMVPLRYEISIGGVKYEVNADKDPDDGSYMANFAAGNMLIYADDTMENGKSLLVIGNNGTDIEAGIYQFSVFAPSADGSEIRQDFTLIVTDGTTKTATAITVTAQNAEFGAAFSAAASVLADGSEIAGAALEYWLNGKRLADLNDMKVLLRGGFLLGENELRVVYAGDDTHAPSVATAAFTVSKPAAPAITGYTPLADGPFTGSAYTVTLNNPQIVANGTVLNASPAVTVEYRLNGQPVSAAVFPGTYTVALKTEGAETYYEIEQDIGSFTIEKAAPTVTVNAEDKGNGVVNLTVTVAGIDPYTPIGKVSILWGDKTLEAALNGGAGSYQVTDAEATLTTYKASYEGDTNYTAADSAEGTITPSGAAAVTYTVTYDWGTDAPAGETLPADGSAYPTAEAAKAAVDGKYTAGFISNAQKDGRDGTWTFSGWTAGVEGTVVKFTGSWSFAATPEKPPVTPPETTPTYTVTAEQAEGGKLSLSTSRAAAGTTVTVTVTPDEGFRLASLTVRDGNGNSVAVTAGSNNTYSFTMPAGRVSVNAAFVLSGETGTFRDVPAGSFYYAAVEWAVAKGITTGTSPETFSPNAGCTRAETVTFLWRAAGSPEPQSTENPFTDLNTSAYYYKAVLWAVEQGITVGTSATTFSPDATVTRAQTVTFLARAVKAAETGSSRFEDVADDAYYAAAVLWAEKNSVTTGTGEGKFSPDADCTRAQIVTFLWRASGSRLPQGTH